MIAGAYVLHVYCDAPGHDRSRRYSPFVFAGITESGAVKEACKAGWQLNPDGSAICPACQSAQQQGTQGEQCTRD